MQQRDTDALKSAAVRPSVNFEKLETVLVITSFEQVDTEEVIGTEHLEELPSEDESTPEPKEKATIRP